MFLTEAGAAFEILCGAAPPEVFPAYAENLPIARRAHTAPCRKSCRPNQ